MDQLQFRNSKLQSWLSQSLGKLLHPSRWQFGGTYHRLFPRRAARTILSGTPTSTLGVSRASRCLPALALFLPTLLSLYLVVTHGKLYGYSFVMFVRESRASVQILVQVLAHVLSIAQVNTLCTLFNFETRLKVERVAMTLRKLSLWSALSNVKVDWSLPPLYLLTTIFVAFLSIVPGALWAGALTPVVTQGRILTESVDVASYSTSSANVWNSEFHLDENNSVWNWISNCITVHDRRGLLPSCPAPSLQAPLLLSASSATIMDGGPRIHAKLDNPEWTYIGRSYGVGSSVGLTLPSFGVSGGSNLLANIHYLESGYEARVTCFKNSSSEIALEYIGDFGPSADHLISYYALHGHLPNEPPELEPEFYPIPVFNSSSQKIAAWAARSWQGRNVLVVVTEAGAATSILDKIQCEVTFAPTQFQVSVDLESNTITATIVTSPAQDFEPSGSLTSNVIHSLNLLSRMSPSLYLSLVGDALMTNVQNVQNRLNATDVDETMVTRAVADSFTAMIDDILVAYGASQLVIAADSTPVKAFGDAFGVRLGDLAYIYAVVALNLIVIAVYLIRSVRTRFWSGLPKFNYADLKTMVLAALAGGIDISRRFPHWHTQNGFDEWDGDGGDLAFEAIRIQVYQRRIMPAIVVDGAEEDDDHEGDSVQTSGSEMQDFSTKHSA